jgi:thiol-disulfide isomerase/thioredoxin
MRTTILRSLIACAALLASGQGARAGGGGGAIAWRNSLPAAQAEAKKSHKLLMVDFYTSWCGYCKKLDAETYTDANVIKLSGQVVTIKVDAEREGKDLAMKYGVHGFPTILFLNDTGGVEGMIDGYLPPANFIQTFNNTMKRHQDFLGAQARYQKNSNDVQTAFALEGFYAAQGNGSRTVAMQQQVERLDPQNAKGLLSRSCLYLGDYYSMRGKFDKSVPLYHRALKITREPRDLAIGHLSLAYCNLSQNHLKQALPDLKAIQTLANCPPDLKNAAQQILAKLKEKGIQ